MRKVVSVVVTALIFLVVATTPSSAAGTWVLWTAFGEQPIVSVPNMAWRPDCDQLHVAARATSGEVITRNWADGRGWTGWTNLGGQTPVAPGIAHLDSYIGDVYFPPNVRRTDIVVRGTNDHVFQKFWSTQTGRWSGWIDLGGMTTSTPAVSWSLTGHPHGGEIFPEYRMLVVVRGTDGKLWERWWSGPDGWSNWTLISGYVVGPPALVGGLDTLFARGEDNHIYMMEWLNYGTGWSGWHDLGAPPGGTTSGPAAAWGGESAVNPGSFGGLNVFVRGGDNAIYQKRRDDRQSPWSQSWTRIGGDARSAPGAAGCSSGGPGGQRGRMDISYRSSTNEFIQGYWYGWN